MPKSKKFPLMWKCEICGMFRQDKVIKVHQVHKIQNEIMKLTRNIKYCADKPECVKGARKKGFLILMDYEN